MEYCWARDYKTFVELSDLFCRRGIKYKITKEKMLVENHFFKHETIYIFHIDAAYRLAVDRALADNCQFISDEYCLSKYIESKRRIPENKSWKMWILYLSTIVACIVLCSTFYINYAHKQLLFCFSAIAVAFFCIAYAKKQAIAFFLAMIYETMLIFALTDVYFDVFKCDLITVKNNFSKLIPVAMIGIMIITLVYLSINGLKRYRNCTLMAKCIYVFSIFISFMLIAFTTVVVYGRICNLYQDYLYYDYAEEVKNTEEIMLTRWDQEENITVINWIDEKQMNVLSYYEGNHEKDYSEAYPYLILVYNDNEVYAITPLVKSEDKRNDLWGYSTLDVYKYSLANYLGVSYGAITTIAQFGKDFALQERVIACFMDIYIFAILITVVSIYIEENRNLDKAKLGNILLKK